MSDDFDDLTDDVADVESPNPDAGSKREYRRRINKAELALRESREFWAVVLSTETGRREMWKALSLGHAFEVKFACSPNGFDNPQATWFHAGEQSTAHALWLYLLKMNRAGCLAMMDENEPALATLPDPKRS